MRKQTVAMSTIHCFIYFTYDDSIKNVLYWNKRKLKVFHFGTVTDKKVFDLKNRMWSNN